jgi:hypothetical protein
VAIDNEKRGRGVAGLSTRQWFAILLVILAGVGAIVLAFVPWGRDVTLDQSRSGWQLFRDHGVRFHEAEVFDTGDVSDVVGFTGIVPIVAGALFVLVGALLGFNADSRIATLNRPFPYPRRIEIAAKVIVVIGVVLLAACGFQAFQNLVGVALACGALVFVALAAVFLVAFPPEDLR